MSRMKKAKILVEVELNDNVENMYPNYRFNFGNRGEFIKMIQTEIENIVCPENGAAVKVSRIN